MFSSNRTVSMLRWKRRVSLPLKSHGATVYRSSSPIASKRLPWDDDSFDRVLAIHVLEHLYNLPAALEKIARVLRPGGVFCVVIPCEGGRLYSLGRRFTTKRMFEKRYKTPYEWMIRQEHCNTAREVLAELDRHFQLRTRRFFPLRVPAVDLNLVIGLELSLDSFDA